MWDADRRGSLVMIVTAPRPWTASQHGEAGRAAEGHREKRRIGRSAFIVGRLLQINIQGRWCYCCICIVWSMVVMFRFMFVMIHSEPAMINRTIRTPNASAMTLLLLSGPVVMWMKKTR